jgi:hypothetical protein
LKIRNSKSTKRFGKTNSDDEISPGFGSLRLQRIDSEKTAFYGKLEKGIQNITDLHFWEKMKDYPELEKVIKQLTSEKQN